jgi:hypothetical protein
MREYSYQGQIGPEHQIAQSRHSAVDREAYDPVSCELAVRAAGSVRQDAGAAVGVGDLNETRWKRELRWRR